MNVPNWVQIPLVIVGTTGMVGVYALCCALVGSRFDPSALTNCFIFKHIYQR